jgi:mannose-6-phosphate isomerase-like protein (cupin superfamily)
VTYVSASEALNVALASLVEISDQLGRGDWRKPIVGSDKFRVVLLQLSPGEEPHRIHRHPRSDEVLIVLKGSGEFTIGDESPVIAGPMTVLYAPADVRHRIRVPGPAPLQWLSVVSPNLDTPDEAIEEAD